ncbi:hypothetical protein DQG13_26780 [Paenibacillus sp. YN15]|nr:hypothetical protein DQG13_26780 [Paenibacillus sp. YN15]
MKGGKGKRTGRLPGNVSAIKCMLRRRIFRNSVISIHKMFANASIWPSNGQFSGNKVHFVYVISRIGGFFL